MSSAPPCHELPFGLIELDADGVVLYYKPERREQSTFPLQNIVGENFFADVMRGADITELKERLISFRRSQAPAASFVFSFSFEHGVVAARVLLASIHDRSELGTAEHTLIHLRKA